MASPSAERTLGKSGRPLWATAALGSAAALATLVGLLLGSGAGAVGEHPSDVTIPILGPLLGTTTTTNPTPPPRKQFAYWLVATDGGIFSFGGAPFYGSTGAMHLNKPIVGMTGTADSAGYWLVASDGGIFSYGDAHFWGSTGSMVLNKPIVGMTVTPDGAGYWLVATDGGIFAFGDAHFYGSTGAMHLNKPVVGMTATPDGGGYWLVASDGGIFAFGDAQFYGSTGNLTLNKPIVAMAATGDGKGYWFSASDGGVFAYGDAFFYGSLGGQNLSNPIVSMAATPTGKGYWFTDSAGVTTAYGDAPYWGSAPRHLNQPVVAMAAATVLQTIGSAYPSGATGYDISNYQCSPPKTGTIAEPLPPGPTIGVVQVNGWGMSAVNSCMANEATWAGPGLNLYTFLSCLDSPGSSQPCTYAQGFAEAQFAYQAAKTAGVDASVGWWLDVEPTNGDWDPTNIPNNPNQNIENAAANASVVQGALTGLEQEGVPSVGTYTSPLTWAEIVGNYSPASPIWLAWYTGDPQGNCTNGRAYAASHNNFLPTGAMIMTQFTSSYTYLGQNFDEDYAC